MGDIKINKGSAAFLPLMVAAFNVFILLFPLEMTEAAKAGASLWLGSVLPSLAPFIVGANLLMALGAAHFLGVLLNPLMRPLFGVPGGGGFAFAVGLMSGGPVGAKITCELRERGAVTQTEGQRLLSFTNNCGPLFIMGAVAAVMLGNVAAGYYIMAAHYLGAVITGMLFKFYGGNVARAGFSPPAPRGGPPKGGPRKSSLWRAFYAMTEARRKNNRPLGQLLGHSVMKAMETLLLIGGFIIVFSVLSRALELLGVFAGLANLFSRFAPLPEGLYEGIFTGFLEMAGGTGAISALGGNRLTYLALIGVISWGGLSVHAQAASHIGKSGLSAGIYLLSKLLHAAISVGLGIIMYPLFRASLATAAPVAAGSFPTNALEKLTHSSILFGHTMLAVLAVVAVVTLLGALFRGGKGKPFVTDFTD